MKRKTLEVLIDKTKQDLQHYKLFLEPAIFILVGVVFASYFTGRSEQLISDFSNFLMTCSFNNYFWGFLLFIILMILSISSFVTLLIYGWKYGGKRKKLKKYYSKLMKKCENDRSMQ